MSRPSYPRAMTDLPGQPGFLAAEIPAITDYPRQRDVLLRRDNAIAPAAVRPGGVGPAWGAVPTPDGAAAR